MSKGISIPGLESRTPQSFQRMSMLIWGTSGCGKTTLASTAPGQKLWLLFDPDGDSALTHRDDVHVLDFSQKEASIAERFREENCLGIDKLLKEHEEIETVVIDSVTSFGELALEHGVKHAAAKRPKEGITIEDPGFGGFGRKNTWTRYMVFNLARLTARMNRHVIFICHEDNPAKDREGNTISISMMLGSTLNEQIPLKLSEIWRLSDNGKKRTIYARPFGVYRPMKSRMFNTVERPSFEWNYNALTDEGEGIATWYEKWKANSFNKIELP